MELTRNFS